MDKLRVRLADRGVGQVQGDFETAPSLGDVVSELGTYMQMPVARLGWTFGGQVAKQHLGMFRRSFPEHPYLISPRHGEGARAPGRGAVVSRPQEAQALRGSCKILDGEGGLP